MEDWIIKPFMAWMNKPLPDNLLEILKCEVKATSRYKGKIKHQTYDCLGLFTVPPKESDNEDNITQYEKSGYRYFGCEKCGKVVHLDHLREHICNSLPRTKNGVVICNGCGRELDHYHYYSPCPICGYNPLEKK